MSNVSKLIHREITNLFPGLQKVETYSNVNLGALGFEDISMLMLNKSSDKINFILTHYKDHNGSLVANPSVEILLYPKLQQVEIVSYKDPYLTHYFSQNGNSADALADSKVNRLVYEWLKNLRLWSRKAMILH